MPKYWGKHGRFPEVGQKQKTEREKRLNDSSTKGLTSQQGLKDLWLWLFTPNKYYRY